MSFQWIIDNAEAISIDRSPIVGQSITRNQTVRAVNRGASIWKFTVTLPNGLRWTDFKNKIALAQNLGRYTPAAITLGGVAGQSWLTKYQGNSANYTAFQASITKGSDTITLTTSPTTSSGYKFRAGDLIQLGGSGRTYAVAADVAYNSNSVQLHRPVLDTTATGVPLLVAENTSWTVLCTQFPQWSIATRDIVSWNGPFVFYENMV